MRALLDLPHFEAAHSAALLLVDSRKPDRLFQVSRGDAGDLLSEEQLNACVHAHLSDTGIAHGNARGNESGVYGHCTVPCVLHNRRFATLVLVTAADTPLAAQFGAPLQQLAELFAAALSRHEQQQALEQAMNQAEQHRLELQSIIDALPAEVLYKDDQNTVVDCNRAAATTLGLPKEQIRGRRLDELTSAGEADEASRADRAVLSSGEPSIGRPEEHGSTGGTIRYLKTDRIPLRSASGVADRLVTVTTDHTDIIVAQRSLEELQARFQRATAGTSDGLWEFNPESGEMWYSETFKALVGLDAHADTALASLPTSWFDLLHPDDADATPRAFHDHLKSQAPFDTTHRLRMPTGEYRWFRARGRSARDDQGRVVHMSGSISDIHEHQTAQSRLDLATRAARVGLWDWDVPTGQTFFSDTYYTMLGYKPHELPMSFETWRSLVHPDDLESVLADIDRHLSDPEAAYSIEHRLRRADGSWLWIRSIGEVVERLADGAAKRMIGVHVDVQQVHEALAAAKNASKEKSLFLANMSHEIRTPMTSILGYADLLCGEDEFLSSPERASQAMRTIHANASHLLTIINDILDVSKIEAGQLDVESLDVSPAQLIEEVASVTGPRAHSKGIELRVRYDTLMPRHIKTDPTRLRQILYNIVGNAIKFTEMGSVTIRAACDPATHTMRFDIVDTGIGMRPEERDLIARFEAFSQADRSMTRRFGGTGLGLRISNGLAAMLGGRIEIESSLGKGSTFTLTINPGDLRDVEMIDHNRETTGSDGASAANRPSPTPAGDRPLEGVRVLLAEDGPDNQRLLSFHLRKAGADVSIYDNGLLAAEAIERAAADHAPHLVLMDMQMPELDGYDATRRLRAHGFDRPIIAVTAHAMEGDRERCLEAGCDDYLTKPIDRAALIEACVRWCERENGSSNARRAA